MPTRQRAAGAPPTGVPPVAKSQSAPPGAKRPDDAFEIPPARLAALVALGDSLAGTDLQAALDQQLTALRRHGADPRDTALATELAYGYMRLKGRLDHLINVHIADPARLPPPIRLLLGVAVYEMTQLSRVPAYATVDWAVTAVRLRHGQGLSRLVNAVLRTIQRLGDDVHNPAFYRQDNCAETAFLSRFHSCPEWMAHMAVKAFGLEGGAAFLSASASPPPLGVRINLSRPGSQSRINELAMRQDCLWSDGSALAFAAGSQPLAEDAYAHGWASRQSAAAQQALWILGPERWDGPIWDACCGRGGKTLALAERSLGPLWASDPNARRLRQLRAEARRLGLSVPLLFRASAEAPPLRAAPTAILLDVPCSGLGVLARRPDIKWKRTPQDIPALLAIQQAMLRSALATLPTGGEIAYITCTMNPKENVTAVTQALESRPGASLAAEFPPDPHNPLGEFFYAALLRV